MFRELVGRLGTGDVVAGKKLKLTEDDLLFLDTLHACGFDHVSEVNLKTRLQEHGMTESTFNVVRHKLLFARFIGSVYGNFTLEKKDYRPVEAKLDDENT